MRLTLKTNLAARVLMHCAVNSGRLVRSSEIAVACNASGNHLSQVIHRLQQLGYVNTQRGRGGGLSLALDAGEISIGQLFREFEGGAPFGACFAAQDNDCPLTPACRLRGHVSRAVEAFYGALDEVTLRALIEDNAGLERILRPPVAVPCGAPQG
ncbi:MAG: RrF2 family transcriptional regulator [Maritimibacter sp.]